METTIKTFVKYLRDWYVQEYQDDNVTLENFNEKNNIDLLKFLKLVFFVSAARGKDGYLINSDFSNFYALPLGPVESRVYEIIKHDNLISFADNKLHITLGENENLNNFYCPNIEADFNQLKIENPNLIKLCSYDLVNLSHKWASWELAFNKAKDEEKKSYPMSNTLIMNDLKYYFL